MPTGLVEYKDGMGAGVDGLGDLLEMLVHRACVAVGQDEAGSLALLRTDGAEDVGPFGALVAGSRWAGAAPGPTTGDLVLLPYPGFVGPPEFDFSPLRERRLDGCQLGREAFLKSSTANSFWA